ncbi:hypothetical protein D3C73_278190 [compost metagenome]
MHNMDKLKNEDLSIDEILEKELPETNGKYFGWEGYPRITADDLKDYQGRS